MRHLARSRPSRRRRLGRWRLTRDERPARRIIELPADGCVRRVEVRIVDRDVDRAHDRPRGVCAVAAVPGLREDLVDRITETPLLSPCRSSAQPEEIGIVEGARNGLDCYERTST